MYRYLLLETIFYLIGHFSNCIKLITNFKLFFVDYKKIKLSSRFEN